MNKFFLASSIFSLLFVIYVWIFYLPLYENTEIYYGVRTVVIAISITLTLSAIITAYLAIRQVPKEEGF